MIEDKFSIETFPSIEKLQSLVKKKRAVGKRICIVTEEIIGPVPNGGIATTYSELADFLVEWGYSVTILFTKGRRSQNKDIDYWIEFYKKKSITLTPLKTVSSTNSTIWQKRQLSVLNFFRSPENNFDLIHVSEWRGMGYFCLLAKRLGLLFENTNFIVKASSPHIWNRHYGLLPIDRREMSIAMFSEQRSIELADIVVGGSAHLLSFMNYIGYQLPKGRCFVQPNIIKSFDRSKGTGMATNSDKLIRNIEHVVFFGRLEYRKGLTIFLDALEILVEQKITLRKVTFLGKEGGRLPMAPDITPTEYINSRTASWPIKCDIKLNYDQPQAMDFLSTGNHLAVMPSLIENSSLAVYEALLLNIPFIASDVGGTSELIKKDDQKHVLCKPDPISLAEKISFSLENGAFVPRISFDNDSNVNVWKNFHEAVISAELDGRSLGLDSYSSYLHKKKKIAISSICMCLLFPGSLSASKIDEIKNEIYSNADNPKIIDLVIIHGGSQAHQDINCDKFPSASLYGMKWSSIGDILNKIIEQTVCQAVFIVDANFYGVASGYDQVIVEVFKNSNFSSYSVLSDDIDGNIIFENGPDVFADFLEVTNPNIHSIVLNTETLQNNEKFINIAGYSGILKEFKNRMSLKNEHELIPVSLIKKRMEPLFSNSQEIFSQELLKLPLYDSLPLNIRKIFMGLNLLPSMQTAPQLLNSVDFQEDGFKIDPNSYFVRPEPRQHKMIDETIKLFLDIMGTLSIKTDSRRVRAFGGVIKVYVNSSIQVEDLSLMKPFFGSKINLKKLNGLRQDQENLILIRLSSTLGVDERRIFISQISNNLFRVESKDSFIF